MISKAEGIKTTDYIYDTFGRMVAADGSTYTYRPDGLRASKTVDDHSQRFSYVNGKVVNDGNKKYTYGLELIKSNTAYFLYNIHGDVIQMVNPSGALLKTYNYDAYGNELTRDLDDTNPFRYCGEYYDTETGFIYLRARYYDPMVGRFTTLDGINNIITSIPLTNNLYLYCIDNPIRYVDRTGEFWQEFWEAFKEAVSQHGTQLATAGAISQADSVAPGPADIAAGIFALSILFVCVTQAYDNTISLDFTISIPKTKVETKTETITIADARRLSKREETVIFRFGFAEGGIEKLVPTDADVKSKTGLSFSLIPRSGAAMTTIEKLNETGFLNAVKDGVSHVSVYPVGGTMDEWYKQGVNSIWTQVLLQNIKLVV